MIACIVNPISAAGRTAALIPNLHEGLRSRFGDHVQFYVTESRGDARKRMTSLLRSTREITVVVVGGDGTLQEVVNGWPTNDRDQGVRLCLGLLSSGTGQGFAQSLGLPRSLREQMDVLVQRSCHRIDLGAIDYLDDDGRPSRRLFVNECQLGIGGAVVRDVESRPRRWNGRWTFGASALRHALTLPNHPVEISVDGGPAEPHTILGVVVGNGAFTGGGMNLTPGASPFDGELDLLIMAEQTVLRRIANLRRIYTASHIGRPEFTLRRCHDLKITSVGPVPLEADGEFLGTTPCTISVVPSAIPFLVPRRFV